MRKITAALAFILCGTLLCSCGAEDNGGTAVLDSGGDRSYLNISEGKTVRVP